MKKPKKPNTDPTSPSRYSEELKKLTYSVSDAAFILGIGRDSTYNLIRSNSLRVIRVGAGGMRYRVPRFEIEAYLKRTLEENNASQR